MPEPKGTVATAVDSVAKIADVMADPENDSALLEAITRIADSLDRAVALLEDLAAAVELPALNRESAVYEEETAQK